VHGTFLEEEGRGNGRIRMGGGCFVNTKYKVRMLKMMIMMMIIMMVMK
jgi:hypothetical protein